MATSRRNEARFTLWLLALGGLIVASVAGCRGGCSRALQPEGSPPELIRRVSSPTEEAPVRVDVDEASPRFLIAGMYGPIRIWAEAGSGAAPEATIPAADGVLEARFSPAGVFFALEQGPTTLWNWREQRALHAHDFGQRGRQAAISTDGRFVAFADRVLEVETDHELGEPKPLATQSALAFSASGKRVVSAGFQEPRIVVRDLPSGAARSWLAPGKVSHAALSPSGDLVAASVAGGRVHFWRQPSGEEQGSWHAHAEARGICFRPSGSSVVIVDPQGLSVVDVARTQQTFRANVEGELWVFACDGELIAAGTTSGELWLWDVARQLLRARLRLSSSAVAAIDISARRQRIAAADEKGAAAIWSWR